MPLWKHPRVRKNPKTIGAALFLMMAGIGFLIGSCIEYGSVTGSQTRGTLFLIIALLTGLPGCKFHLVISRACPMSDPPVFDTVYSTVYIYKALMGRPGYHFSYIPSFDA